MTERVVRKITLDLHANLVETTPVDTGWARANWVPRVRTPIDEAVGSPDGGGISAAQAAANSGIAQVLNYRLSQGRVFVSNAVPYIERLNDGSSTQAPAGFVQVAIRKAVNAAQFVGVP